MSSRKALRFVSGIADWTKKNQREFPWRHTTDPYRVLIAEYLVQRTRAEQVKPVYVEFIHKWPTIQSLSAASLSEIARVIRPLGLEYRAARIKSISEILVQDFDGCIPNSLAGLEGLYGTGLGEYMAHAILCFAFGQDVPVIDQNVVRILRRVFSVEARKDAHRDPRLWKFAKKLVPRGEARKYNWGLLDFGALVCTPSKPHCASCPILEICDYGNRAVSCDHVC